jgi:hypothetical protein
MKKLEEIILDRIDEKSLYKLWREYPSLRIDYEFSKRLLSCDPEIYNPVLDLFMEKNVKMSKVLKSALYEMRKCFPWRIGVVYDFRNGQVKSLEIRMGNTNEKYRYQSSPILFTWLDANESKLLLREIVSSNSKSSLFSEKLDIEKSEKVRDFLLDNSTVDIDISIIQAIDRPFRTFSRSSPLHGGEDFAVFPTRIKKENVSIELFSKPNSQIISYTNIPIKFSSDVSKYLSVISKI